MIRNTPILVQIFMIFYALPQFGIVFDQFTVAWLSVMIWGGAFNSENFRAGFEAVPHRYREAAAALGFSRLATFLNVTLPIGGRIALPSSINTYISVLKNTSLMYVIGYPELTTTALNISNLTLETTEALTVLAFVYLTLVWGAVGADPAARGAARAPGGALMSISARGRRRAIGVLLALAGGAVAVFAWRAIQDCRLVRAGRPLHPLRGPAGHAQSRRGRRCRQHADRRHVRDADDDPLPAAAGADPPLHRGLPRPADPRHRLRRLLRAARRSRRGSSSRR